MYARGCSAAREEPRVVDRRISAAVLLDYFARLAVTTSTSFLRPKAQPLDEVRTPMRAWLTDIDINRHVNNGKYLTLMDFARLDHSLRTGMLKPMVKRGWWPIMGGATVNYRREIKPLWTFEITTRLIAWDDKWLYGEHRFERNGTLHTQAYAKAVIKKGRETVPPSELMKVVGVDPVSPEAPEGLKRWIEVGAA